MLLGQCLGFHWFYNRCQNKDERSKTVLMVFSFGMVLNAWVDVIHFPDNGGCLDACGYSLSNCIHDSNSMRVLTAEYMFAYYDVLSVILVSFKCSDSY